MIICYEQKLLNTFDIFECHFNYINISFYIKHICKISKNESYEKACEPTSENANVIK